MNETEQYILDSIKTWVWSGFYSSDEVHEMVEDILEDDVDEDKMHSVIAPELERKAIAENTWPQITDCDLLDKVFSELNDNGIIAIQNAGYTQSDGFSDVSEELSSRDRTKVKGYCFYHGQDLERAVAGNGLWLAFGDLEDTTEGKRTIGKRIVEILIKAGFKVDWNGDPKERINVPKLNWKRRYHVMTKWKLSSECDANLALPPECSFAETFQKLNSKSNSFFILENGKNYMQCGGAPELCTVELRQVKPNESFRHYVFYRSSGSNESIHIPMSGGGVMRQKKHGLTSKTAAELFECFYANKPWPKDFALEDITNKFA